MINKKRLDRLHRHARLNRTFMVPGKPCHCFHCLKTFMPEAISGWTDDGNTALCPYCGIDSVLSSSADRLTDEVIRQLQSVYFLAPPKTFTPAEWQTAPE
jgi:NAD-dependent SIR2 family protein deacetylase